MTSALNAAFSSAKRVPFGPPDARIRIAEAADLDGDGRLDIVAIDEKRGTAVYFGQKDGTFSPGLTLEDGKISGGWAIADELGLLRQLGAVVQGSS